MGKYVLTDLHGCLKTFERMIEKIGFSQGDELYILGDLIDRGPNSKGVIDLIWKLQSEGYTIECIRGNHDQMMLSSYQNMDWQRTWLFNGGWTTVESFQVDALKDIPSEYFHFIKNMGFYLEIDNYILVHAGLSFKTDMPLEDAQAMMWTRKWYNDIDYEWLKDRIIIHGHTPLPKSYTIEMMDKLHEQRYLNLDTGCVYKGKRKGLGFLTCLNMTTKELIFQENVD